MTEQERAVVEAALELNDVSKDARAQASWAFRASTKLHDAVLAYRKSLEPKPRWEVAMESTSPSKHAIVPTLCFNRQHTGMWGPLDAMERICRLLNQEVP